MKDIKYGVAIAAPTSKDAVDQIIDAEQRGVQSVWGTVGPVSYTHLTLPTN